MRLYWNADLGAWDDIVSQCQGTTFYHRAAWLEAAAGQAASFEGALLELAPGGVAAMPLLARHYLSGLLTIGHSGGFGPWAGYGGLVSTRPLMAEEVEEAFSLIAAACPELRLAGNPFHPGAHLPAPAGRFAPTAGATRVLERRALPPAPPLEPGLTLRWAARPNPSHVDRLEAVSGGLGARRGFYERLFDRARPGQLALAFMLRDAATRAWAVWGFEGAIAHLVGSLAPAGQPQDLASLLAQSVGQMPPGIQLIDLGQASLTLPTGWAASPVPVPGRVRRGWPGALIDRAGLTGGLG